MARKSLAPDARSGPRRRAGFSTHPQPGTDPDTDGDVEAGELTAAQVRPHRRHDSFGL